MDKPFVAQFGIVSGNSYLRSTSGSAAVNSTSDPTYNFEVKGTGALLLPSGNTGQRPSASEAIFRYNSELDVFEGYANGTWGSVGGAYHADVSNSYLQSTFLKLAGGTLTGNLTPSGNTTNLGNTIARWNLVANTGEFSGAVTSSTGFYPASNSSGSVLGSNDKRFTLYANTVEVSGTGINPLSNSDGITLGTSDKRFNLNANTIITTNGIFPLSNSVGASLGNTTNRFLINASNISVAGGIYPLSNTVGMHFGADTNRWNVVANIIAAIDIYSNAVVATGHCSPTNNTTGNILGWSGAKWNLTANSVLADQANVAIFSVPAGGLFNVNCDASFGKIIGIPFSRPAMLTTGVGSNGAIQIYSSAPGTAYISFHNGTYTMNFGMDNDHQLTCGGASFGTTMASAKFASLGIGTAAIGYNSIVATGTITESYSDGRLKTNIETIPNALDKVVSLRGITYTPNELAIEFGVGKVGQKKIGLIASEVQNVAPETISIAPFDMDQKGNSKSGENYLTIKYEHLVPLLVEAIKDLSKKVNNLEELCFENL